MRVRDQLTEVNEEVINALVTHESNVARSTGRLLATDVKRIMEDWLGDEYRRERDDTGAVPAMAFLTFAAVMTANMMMPRDEAGAKEIAKVMSERFEKKLLEMWPSVIRAKKALIADEQGGM